MNFDRKMKTEAVYWSKTGTDFEGDPAYGTAADVKCYWMDKQEKFTDPNGVEKISRGVVYLYTSVAWGGVLVKGTVAGLSAPSVPLDNTGAVTIQAHAEIPNRRGTQTLYKAWF